MDYQKLIGSLLAEARQGIRYKQFDPVVKVFAIICMIPFYVITFFGIVGYYVALFFYNALLSPCYYLEAWEKEHTKDMHFVPKAVVLFFTTTFIFSLRMMMAFFSFFFYFQWFSLQINLYICTLGGTRFQPWVNTATFDEELTWNLLPEKKRAQKFIISMFVFEVAPIALAIIGGIFAGIAADADAQSTMEICAALSSFFFLLIPASIGAYLTCAVIVNPIIFKKQPVVVEAAPAVETPAVEAEVAPAATEFHHEN